MMQCFRIGIIGDGQLALMLAESLQKMDVPFLSLSHADESPMHTFFPENVTNDEKRFQQDCSVFTLENEFHTIQELKTLLGEKAQGLFPDLQSYSFFADKISQRTFYAREDIPSPRWCTLEKEEDLVSLSDFPYPFVLKTSKGGYDGKGVRIVTNKEELESALIEFNFYQGNPLLVEEKVAIVKEVAQGFIRSKEGKYTLLPLVETVQEQGVCNLVKYPADVSPDLESQVEAILLKIIHSGLTGIFNFEFFIDSNGKVLINEGAPRTHNSQHLTMNASPFSQFDLLAMYLTTPAHAPEKISAKKSLMVNILGKSKGEYGDLKLPDLGSLEVHGKLYGKKLSSPGRKMGHVNVIDKGSNTDLLTIGRKILKEYEL
ncbi:MAG: ATP-grasp domain-containing protein [Bacteriovoracia bacterium]